MNAIRNQPNEVADFWNEVLAPKFIEWRHNVIDVFSRHSAGVIALLDIREGDRILDVACGFGDTAIALAQRTGPTGSVLGIDCCRAFLDLAEDDAARAGVDNVGFVEADVETVAFDPAYDWCYSRFGAMYFTSPVAGFRTMRSALKPGGRLVCTVWRSIEDNPFLLVPKQVVLDYLEPPGEDGRGCGPGPFAMADPEVVRRQLEIAGFSDIEFECVAAPVRLGDSAAQAAACALALGPAGEVFREAGEEGVRHVETISAALTEELSRYRTGAGIVMDSSSWCISARNPVERHIERDRQSSGSQIGTEVSS